MNPKISFSASSAHNTSTEQPVAIQDVEQNSPSIGFFAIGMVINIGLITAYIIWAYRQWKKTDKRDQ